MSLVKTEIGKQIRLADGTLMEEVFLTERSGSGASLVTKRILRPFGQKEVPKPQVVEDVSEIEEEDVFSESTEAIMDKLIILQLCLEEGYLTKEEHDLKRRAVLQQMISSSNNPSRVVGRAIAGEEKKAISSPVSASKTKTETKKNDDLHSMSVPMSSFLPTGICGISLRRGPLPVVVDKSEHEMADRREGREHDGRIIRTTVTRELFNTGTMRETKVQRTFDAYSNTLMSTDKSETMIICPPHVKSISDYDKTNHHNDHHDDDDVDDVEIWSSKKGSKTRAEEDDEDARYQRVMMNALEGKHYTTHNVNNPAGRAIIQGGGQYLYPGKKNKNTKSAHNPWKGFEESWEDNKKTKKNNKKNVEHLRDDGSGGGGFKTGEAWGEDAKQHEGDYAAGGSHFVHQDSFK